jgi:FkbM family methyltransferase
MIDIEILKNSLFVIQACRNRMEIVKAYLKRQEPAKIILNNGLQIIGAEGPLWAARLIFGDEVYNPWNFLIQENDIVVDIGANIGVFALYAACKTKNAVYAYEPYPENFESLVQNIHLNNLDHIHPFRLAVTDEIGEAMLFLSETCEGHMVYDNIIKGKLDHYINVPTITLQEIIEFNELERIDFLKMDCEGQEGAILKSTPGIYLKKIKKIVLEFHDALSDYKHQFIQKILVENGFDTKLIWDGKSHYGYIYAWN